MNLTCAKLLVSQTVLKMVNFVFKKIEWFCLYQRIEMDYLCDFLEMHGRPRSIKLYLQPHAGAKHGASHYKNKVLPLFLSADVSVERIGKEI